MSAILKSRSGVLIAAVGLLLLIVAGVWVLSRRGDRDTPESKAGMPMEGGEATGGGMAGMEIGEEGTVRLTPDQIQTFGVTFGRAEVRPLERTIRAVGVVDFDETRMAYVAPKFGGFVERLYVDFTSQPVSRGQPLMDVYSPELVSAQEELLLARRLGETIGRSGVEGVAGGATDLLDSAVRRLRYWDISQAQIDRLLRTGQVERTMTLYAPVSGIVMEKNVFEGQAFRPGENLYMIADLSEVWIEAELFEADAGIVEEGMPAEITIAAYPGRTYDGRVEYVYPTLQEQTRSMQARIVLANPGGRLKPGMYATVELEKQLGEVLAVPSSAVLRTGERAIAFVDIGGGRLMPHELILGMAGGEYIEVLEGLDPGMRVVTSAQYLLDSESNLAEVMRAMMAQMNLSDMDAMDMEGMDMEGIEGMQPPAGSEPDTAGMEMDMPGMNREH